MRRLRTIILQDLAVLQPRYPTLPFFSHAPFYGPAWDEFALAVRSDVAVGTEPPSLLLQRALPELSGVLESSREAVLQNSQRLANRLESKLQGIQDSVDALLQGHVPITFTGYFGTGPVASPVVPIGQDAVPTPVPTALSTSASVNVNASVSPGAGVPIVTALTRAFTVKDVWREWQEGIAGQPAIRELEEKWGSRWRPTNAVRVQFCRRKVIWDEVLARVARGKSADAAVAELELLRAGRSINHLVDELKQRRQGWAVGGGSGSSSSNSNNGQRVVRGQGRRGRWGRWGRRGGPPPRQARA